MGLVGPLPQGPVAAILQEGAVTGHVQAHQPGAGSGRRGGPIGLGVAGFGGRLGQQLQHALG